jgi:hypothetical protein
VRWAGFLVRNAAHACVLRMLCSEAPQSQRVRHDEHRADRHRNPRHSGFRKPTAASGNAATLYGADRRPRDDYDQPSVQTQRLVGSPPAAEALNANREMYAPCDVA